MIYKKIFFLTIFIITFPAYGMRKIQQQASTFLKRSQLISNLLKVPKQKDVRSSIGISLGATAISYFLQQQHVYADEDSTSPSPTLEELFKHSASYQAVKDADKAELSQNPKKIKQYLTLAKEHFAELYQTSHGALFLEKLLEKDKSSVSDFTQLAIDNLVLVAKKYSGRKLIEEIIKQNSSYLDYVKNNNNPVIKQLIDKANQNFAALITKYEGIDILEMLARKNSDARLLFATSLSNNVSAIFEETYKKQSESHTIYCSRRLSRLIEKHPHIKDLLQKHVEEQVQDIVSYVTHSCASYDTVEFFRFLMNLDKNNGALYVKTLIEDLASGKRGYKGLSSWYFLQEFFVGEDKELFLMRCIQMILL